MKSAYAALPPEIRERVNSKRREDELEYWRQREQLLESFQGFRSQSLAPPLATIGRRSAAEDKTPLRGI